MLQDGAVAQTRGAGGDGTARGRAPHRRPRGSRRRRRGARPRPAERRRNIIVSPRVRVKNLENVRFSRPLSRRSPLYAYTATRNILFASRRFVDVSIGLAAAAATLAVYRDATAVDAADDLSIRVVEFGGVSQMLAAFSAVLLVSAGGVAGAGAASAADSSAPGNQAELAIALVASILNEGSLPKLHFSHS